MSLPGGAVGWSVIVAFSGHAHFLIEPIRREHNGSVVESFIKDPGAAGSNLTGVTVLCP